MRKGMWTAVVLAMVMACGFGLKAKAASDAPAVGSTAPNFTLPSQEDKPVSLTDYKGKWVVLYFYPKDQTTGCTIKHTISSATWRSMMPQTPWCWA